MRYPGMRLIEAVPKRGSSVVPVTHEPDLARRADRIVRPRDRRTWIPAPGDPDETDRVIRAVASGDLSQRGFRDWIAERCG
jgi:ABC-type lipoprotein export system ATPase subunit